MLSIIQLISLLLLTSSLPAFITALAFPGATGFGQNALGGRGGDVYTVNNLLDSGPGSLRDAISKPNRTIVFSVGGVIKIKSRLVFKERQTIAGQTAPGDGITVYGNGVSFSNAHHAIVRYIRFRMGKGGDSGKDAVGIAEGRDMVFDHVSASWGRDETFSISGEKAQRITIQDSIVGMGLQTHSCGGLIQTDGGVSILRTLYIDNHTRNPKVKGKNDFVNNVIYNWGGGGGYILGDSDGASAANIQNNYFISGPSTQIAPFTRGNQNFRAYVSGNFQDLNKNGVLDGVEIPKKDYTNIAFEQKRFEYPIAKILTAKEALDHVIQNAGASKVRDAVDKRFIDEVRSLGKEGQILDDEKKAPFGGIGTVRGGQTLLDSDGDGMPDEWEIKNGLNPKVKDHNGMKFGNGYTNLENYINSLI